MNTQNQEQIGSFTTANGQTFGVQGFTNASPLPKASKDDVSPNAARWLFNPFAYVNVSERPVSGHLHLRPGAFIPIVTQMHYVALPNQPALTPGSRHQVNDDFSTTNVGVADSGVEGAPKPGYRREARSAFAIASELEAAYSEKGVRVLASLTGFEDAQGAAALHETLVAPGLEFAVDGNQPDHPVPNLVKLERHLATVAAATARSLKDQSDKPLPIDPVELVGDLLVSVRTALGLCRTVTREGMRHVANKTNGYQHTFDAWHQRCFLALGEAVPSDLPFNAGNNAPAQQATPSDNSAAAELARLREENEALNLEKYQREIDELKAENERLKTKQSRPAGVEATGEYQQGLSEPTAADAKDSTRPSTKKPAPARSEAKTAN